MTITNPIDLLPKAADGSAPLEPDLDKLLDDAAKKFRAMRTEPLDEKGEAAAKALRAVVQLERDVRGKVERQVARSGAGIDSGAKLAAAGANGASVGAYDPREVKGASDAYRMKFVRGVVQQLGDQFEPKASSLAAAAVDAVRALGDEIERERANALGPFAPSPLSALDETRLVERLKACGAKGCSDALENAIKFDDEEQITSLLHTIPLALAHIFDTPAALLAAQRKQRNDVADVVRDVGRDQLTARDLLRKVEQMKTERLPDDVVLAARLLTENLKVVFDAALGVNARAMSRPAFERFAQRVLAAGGEVDPFEVAEDWLTRRIDPRALALPPSGGGTQG